MKKNKRLELRISPQFAEELQELADNLGFSKAKVLETCFYIANESINFINCPSCKTPHFPHILINVWGEMQCTCRKCGEEFTHKEEF